MSDRTCVRMLLSVRTEPARDAIEVDAEGDESSFGHGRSSSGSEPDRIGNKRRRDERVAPTGWPAR